MSLKGEAEAAFQCACRPLDEEFVVVCFAANTLNQDGPKYDPIMCAPQERSQQHSKLSSALDGRAFYLAQASKASSVRS